MSFDSFESVPETADTKFSGFQNDLFVDNPLHTDLMPKIRFTTDADEAAAAAQADRSNPCDLPDSVFYVEPKETAEPEKKPEVSGFQNDSFHIKVENFETGAAGDASGGDYYGPSSAALDIKIENATKDLTYAQLQLEQAIENGTGVMSAMQLVESAQKLVDTYVQQHSEAVMAEARQAADLCAKSEETGEVKLGSVSHAQWELERAYQSGNSVRIHYAERDLAHEKAKEKAKEMD